MTTTTLDNRGGGGKILLLFVAIIIVLAVAIGSLSSLPMTQHAAQGRAGTTMDADAIRRMIDDRACKPIEFYICPPVNQSKALCYLKITETDELWAGVIVGLHTPNNIITGYVAPYFDYWIEANERDGCYLDSRIN
jgi:hypothetical protein